MKKIGLTDEEVQKSREQHGSNVIPDSEPTTFWDEFKATFRDPMIRILMAIVVIMLIMFFLGRAEIYEPIGTITAVLIVALVSAKTAVASDIKYRELKDSTKKDTCKVYRNGIISIIEVDDVVVGDKIILQSGDKIPADGILVEGDLRVDNSVLNGEAEECKKYAAPEGFEFPKDLTGETFVDKHSLFRGAVVFDGEGIMDVRKVGLKTMMGRMAEEMQEDEPDSPLQVKLSKLAKQISAFGYVSAVVIVILYVAYFIIKAGGFSAYAATGWSNILMNVIEAVSLAIIIVVCAVPEGLPLMISLVLMQNTSRMLDHNVLVRKAVGIETAGSLNILFSDKTGTITKGSLEVVEFFTPDGAVIPLDQIKSHGKVKSLVNIAIGKNTASFFDGEHRVIGGNATDQALMRFLGEDEYKFLSSGTDKATDYSVGLSQGFNSVNKFSQAEIRELKQVFYKGAPEKFVTLARKGLNADGNVVELFPDVLNEKINEYASRAMRVLAFGYSDSPFKEDTINDDVVLIGLVAIRDDVRTEAKEAIKEVQGAGVQVVMITGDRLETAVSIAKDAGLMQAETDRALTSAQLNAMSDEEVKKTMKDIRVIARALPTDKSRMVRLCQEMNLVVGMTGDGVNDSPALKRADVGFAMGSGTEAAKEAGEVVIIDDNFRSIKDAILYGRTIYNNILKFCKFQLVINVAAVIVSAASPFFGVVEPLKVTHLLFVNLVMDSLGAIMLGNEPALEKYMTAAPRRRDESIISKAMATQIGIMALWMTIISFCFLKMPVFRDIYGTEEKHLTAFFVFFVVAALFNGFNVRDNGFGIFKGLRDNPGFLKMWFTIVLVQAVIVNAALIPVKAFEWIGSMFSCTPFGLVGWVVAFALAFTMIPIDILRKVLMGTYQ
ncbi:MAG: calcium-translocating P-type ATPase, PMCA-type [Lachnospiraceae bacterium]|nr:calcium-translocating P-type ATPase, PMCA-type [Lachnospiraceae bacterium]